MEFNTTIGITRDEVDEVESRLDELGDWCTSHLTHFGSCAIVMQAVIDKLDEITEFLDKAEDEANWVDADNE